MSAILLHEYLHSLDNHNWVEDVKSCTVDFDWNEMRSYGAESFILLCDFNTAASEFRATWNEYKNLLSELYALLAGKTKDQLTDEDRADIERIKRELRARADQIRNLLDKMSKIADKLVSLRDNLLAVDDPNNEKDSVIIKRYNPSNPDNPNCPLNDNLNKEIKLFVTSLNAFVTAWNNFSTSAVNIIYALDEVGRLLDDLNNMTACNTNVIPDFNPWIPYCSQNVNVDDLPNINPMTIGGAIKRSDDEMHGK